MHPKSLDGVHIVLQAKNHWSLRGLGGVDNCRLFSNGTKHSQKGALWMYTKATTSIVFSWPDIIVTSEIIACVQVPH